MLNNSDGSVSRQVSIGSRFGKHGDAKRKAQIHHGGTGEKKTIPQKLCASCTNVHSHSPLSQMQKF
jgi:hypothetical protein